VFSMVISKQLSLPSPHPMGDWMLGCMEWNSFSTSVFLLSSLYMISMSWTFLSVLMLRLCSGCCMDISANSADVFVLVVVMLHVMLV
jgi:hypothetical protein